MSTRSDLDRLLFRSLILLGPLFAPAPIVAQHPGGGTIPVRAPEVELAREVHHHAARIAALDPKLRVVVPSISRGLRVVLLVALNRRTGFWPTCTSP